VILAAGAVLRVFALTGVDRLIPSFSSLDEALAQASADRLSSWQRADHHDESGLLREHDMPRPSGQARPVP
jgi:hypothetical protein